MRDTLREESHHCDIAMKIVALETAIQATLFRSYTGSNTLIRESQAPKEDVAKLGGAVGAVEHQLPIPPTPVCPSRTFHHCRSSTERAKRCAMARTGSQSALLEVSFESRDDVVPRIYAVEHVPAVEGRAGVRDAENDDVADRDVGSCG